MKMLGLNPMEQEIVELTNDIARNGFIYFPDFCRIIHIRYRDQDQDNFSQNMFKVVQVSEVFGQILNSYLQMLCGTEPLPELFKAKKYKINDNFLTKKDFQHMMMNLPEKVKRFSFFLHLSYLF